MASRARAVDAGVGVGAAAEDVVAAAATKAVSGRRLGVRMNNRPLATGRPRRMTVILSTARRRNGSTGRGNRPSGSASPKNPQATRMASRDGMQPQKAIAILRPVRDDGVGGAAAAAGAAAVVAIAKAMSASALRRTARPANPPATTLTSTMSPCLRGTA
jgi:hypothetical protein